MNRADLREVDRRNEEFKRRENTTAGDYMTFYNQVRRERWLQTPLARKMGLGRRPR